MKKFLFSLAILCTFTIGARQISETEALTKAKEFAQNSVLKTSKGSNTLKLTHLGEKSGEVYYYVFNKGDNNGYVIVSGDDRTKPICGYSDTGVFDYNNIPENMKWWLTTYQAEIDALNSGKIESNTTDIELAKSNSSVAPLLGNIMWNQDAPYNNACPYVSGTTTRSASGCVATAFAQVMMYYKYPQKGVGSFSYTDNGVTRSADFGNTTYDWNSMLPYYTSSSSVASQNAVATLMYHVGVASQMSYGSSSGANTQVAMNGLVQYFNYDKGMQYMMRDYFPLNDWISMLKNELDNARPIVYGGSSSNGGHQFIFDGYDTNDMFHVNWGWGGMNDGYFNVSILTPLTQGIGGSDGGFNTGQDAAIGVMPASANGVNKGGTLYLQSMSASVSSGNKINIGLTNIVNYGYTSFTGILALAICDENGNPLYTPSTLNISSIPSGSGYSSYPLSITLPSIPNGNYMLKMVQSYDGGKTYSTLGIKLPNNYPILNVNNGTATVVTKSASNLAVTNVNIGYPYLKTNWQLSFDVSNTGSTGFYNSLYVKIYNSSNSAIYTGTTSYVEVDAGTTVNVQFSDILSTMSAGNYTIAITNTAGKQLCTPLPIIIYAAPSSPAFKVNSLSFIDNNNVPINNLQLTANITNSGGYFNDGIVGIIFPITGGYSLAQFGNDTFVFQANETRSITVKGSVSLDPGNYIVALYSMNSATGSYDQIAKNLNFKLTNPTSGIESVEESQNDFEIYPNPVSDVLNITAKGEIGNIKIFNLTGSLVKETKKETSIDVSEISNGNYFIMVIVDGKPMVKSFIKK